jgi:alkanesulfonate monooxygenase SsuD/methylene tetrahydromethanopterin reductase-like flavin-dependent oxidoreductase (luciferase family)
MQFGLDVQNIGAFADPRALVELAVDAEAAGWDGFFLWDHISFDMSTPFDVADPWIALAAIAARTSRIRIGTVVTPIARRRPWKLARETVTLDRLSGGRLTLGVGLGWSAESDFEQFGEVGDLKIKAEKTDEALEVLTGLWSAEPFEHRGKHFLIKPSLFLPAPVQQPRIPIWVAGTWPNRAPFRRAARWDGAFPLKVATEPGEWQLTVAEVADMVAFIRSVRADGAAFDTVVAGITGGEDETSDRAKVSAFQAVGCTWWLEALMDERGSFADMQTRVRSGPPKA